MALVHDVLIILVAGMFSQWAAWRLRLPAIVMLIAAGVVVGPVTGLLQITADTETLTGMIGLGVAIILFEGGMDLELREFRRVGHGIGRLVVLGPPLAWLLGSVCTHYIGGLSWPVSMVLGAILVVTGPTVVMPMLRYARLNQDSASLLKWEGIVNDPVGVLLAVLTYQYFTLAGSGWEDTLLAVFMAIAAAAVLGGAGGWLIGQLYHRGLVPEHLKPPVLMVWVLVVYELANMVQHEAGLLAVTLMGLVVGNKALGSRAELRHFKENLSVVLISALFIVLTARLEVAQLMALNWRIGLLLLAFLFLVRPLSVWLATMGAQMRLEDRKLLAWIAPRGIVAAATAGLFGPGMIEAGYADAELLLPTVFTVIMVTVLAHGLTLGRYSQKLKLAAPADNGLLIVGASPWSAALAKALRNAQVEVLLVDGVWSRLKTARLAGVPVYYGEILSEHARDWVATQHLNIVLCATRNDFYNALVCKAQARQFGHHRCFQLPTQQEASHESRRLTRDQRGHLSFDGKTGFDRLNQLVEQGWSIQLTRLSGEYGWKDYQRDMKDERIVLGAIDDSGKLHLRSPELRFTAKAGWRMISFGPPRKSPAAEELEDESN
ncbi:MAG: sodium:proton antiporter [Wenzhouxiangellaceae bacterium]